MTAISWKIDASHLLQKVPRSLLTYYMRQSKSARSSPWTPTAGMLPLLYDENTPNGVSLYSMHVRGNVPVHTDPSFSQWIYLFLVRPGPYVVCDKAMDLSPQLAGTIICFDDHKQHCLVDRFDSEDFMIKSCTNIYEYDKMPSQSWTAIGMDFNTYITEDEAVSELSSRLDRWNKEILSEG